MPVIARFYGIIIKMYFNGHMPPHFHAIYGEFVGMFDIENAQLIEGDLPNRAHKLVVEWAELHKNDLMKMWNNKEFKQLEGLE